MQDNPKILLVESGLHGRNALALALGTACLDIITVEQVKERGMQISQPEPLPYVVQKAPELPEPQNLVPFKEQKNYITGKKLPQKKRRK